MSLKAFHIAFVVVSILFTGGFGVWAVMDFFSAGDPVSLALGVFSFLVGIALVWYSAWFLRKLKNVSFL